MDQNNRKTNMSTKLLLLSGVVVLLENSNTKAMLMTI
jgi:hypothetical protein